MLERISRNWPLKLLSLALAFAIWVAVTGENRVVRDFPVPVAINVSEELIPASTPPKTATVRLRGSESLMRRLDRLPMVLSVDLTDAVAGDQEVQLSENILEGIPRGLEVEFIDPDRLSVVLDRRLRRELRVEPTFLGQPPEGFHFYDASSRPETLLVEGPESELAPVKVIRTNPIRLDRRQSPFTVRVAAVPGGGHVQVVNPSPIEVRVEVDASPVERKFEAIPVVASDTTHSWSSTPKAFDVTLSGPPSLIEPLRPEQIRLVADVTNLVPSVEAQEAELRVEYVDVPVEDQARISAKEKPSTVSVLIGERRNNT